MFLHKQLNEEKNFKKWMFLVVSSFLFCQKKVTLCITVQWEPVYTHKSHYRRAELFFSLKTSKQLILCCPENHEIWNSDPKATIKYKRKRGRPPIETKRKKEKHAVIFLSTQKSWRCIFWATDKQTGSGPLVSSRTRLGRPAGGGGAFRLPFP